MTNDAKEAMDMAPPKPLLTPTTSATPTEWAEMLDVSDPVPEFREQISNMAQTFKFELDNFQKQAILKLEEGHHVMVAAHTSAGKTVVAEYAIAMARRNGTRAIYTSPTKALSNQKFRDLEKIFGDVGLLTGDFQINPTAPCLVMTTEILRSMLFAGDHMRDLEFVVLDEVHFINNIERGHVWEEVLMLLPGHVRMVLLSATIPEPLQFASWLGHIKQRKVYVVSTPKRPVPLCHYLFTGTNSSSRHEMFLVVDQDGNFQLPGYDKAVAAKSSREHLSAFDEFFSEMLQSGPRRLSRCERKYMWQSLVDHLKEQDQVPVVVFMFSRGRCDDIADSLRATEDFTTATEKTRINSCFQKCLEEKLTEEERSLPQVHRCRRLCQNGIAVHHSGILPLLREVIEVLFQCGYIKVLFATETLAVGVNMPARTVVVDDLKKFDGQQFRPLEPAEYAQIAGRAGRRGLDDTGTVIIVCAEDLPDLETLKLILGKPQQLFPQFRLTYSLILNLLRKKTASMEDILRQSYREFHQINQSTTNNYSRQLELAEKEYSEKCRTPLASHVARLELFYNAAAQYIDVLNEIMPILLTTAKIKKEMAPGKILVVSAGPHINQIGVLLSNKSALGLGPKQAPYKVLLLDTKTEENLDDKLDENFYRMLGFSAMYDSIGTKELLNHTIINIQPQNIIAVTKMNMAINHKIIMEVWERNQLPRFKDAPIGSIFTTAVQELSRISSEVYSGTTTLDYISLTESGSNTTDDILCLIEKMNKCKLELNELKKYTDIPNFKTEFAIVYERNLLKRKRDKYRQLSFGHLALYPEYQRRLKVLRELKYIDEHDNVTVKGQVACGIGTYELMISELVFRDVFTDMPPAEIAALLSGFVFKGRMKTGNQLNWTGTTDKLDEGIIAIDQIDEELNAIESKYSVDQCYGQDRKLDFAISKHVYEWALQMPFNEIMTIPLGNVDEGTIVRAIQQVHEIIVNVIDGAVAVGDLKLQAIMTEASAAIRRDIVCSAILSTQEQEAAVTRMTIKFVNLCNIYIISAFK